MTICSDYFYAFILWVPQSQPQIQNKGAGGQALPVKFLVVLQEKDKSSLKE